jgi:hypothetical protein
MPAARPLRLRCAAPKASRANSALSHLQTAWRPPGTAMLARSHPG